TDRTRIESPQRRADQRDFNAEQFRRDQKDQHRGQRADNRTRQSQRSFRSDAVRRSRRNKRAVIPLFSKDDGGGLERLHQHRMFAVRAGESVSAIVGDGVQLVEFVFTQTFGAQPAGAKTKTCDDENDEGGDYEGPDSFSLCGQNRILQTVGQNGEGYRKIRVTVKKAFSSRRFTRMNADLMLILLILSMAQTQLARRLNLFDATMIVMGGIIGSGIFMNPSVVALQVHTPFLILGAWVLGGLFALAAAVIWAELAALRPDVGGQYAYLREAFHPGVAFLYGWVLRLVVETGGMAAVAVTFARYFVELNYLPIPSAYLAALVLATLTLINCIGVRAGSTVQSILMVLKIVAIVMLVVCGFLFASRSVNPTGVLDRPPSVDLLTAFG